MHLLNDCYSIASYRPCEERKDFLFPFILSLLSLRPFCLDAKSTKKVKKKANAPLLFSEPTHKGRVIKLD